MAPDGNLQVSEACARVDNFSQLDTPQVALEVSDLGSGACTGLRLWEYVEMHMCR